MVMEGGEYICDTCNKHFPIRSQLEAHMLSHSDKRVHICPFCDKSFKEKYHLNRHRNTHINVKTFICDICDVCFSRKDSLNSHKLIHSAEKPNKCNQCSKSFKRKGDLRKHEKVHTDARKFECDFNRTYNLDFHKLVRSVQTLRTCRKSKTSSKIISEVDQHVQLHAEHKNVIYERCLVSCNNVSSVSPVIDTRSEEKKQNSDISRLNNSISDKSIRHSGTFANIINFHENIIQIKKPIVSNHEQAYLQKVYKYNEKQTSVSSSFQTQPSNILRTEATTSIEKQTSCVVPSLPFHETKQGICQTCESVHQTILPLPISSSRPEMLNSNYLNFIEETIAQKCNKNSSKFTNIQCVEPPQQEKNESFPQMFLHENSSQSDMHNGQSVCDVIIQSFLLLSDHE